LSEASGEREEMPSTSRKAKKGDVVWIPCEVRSGPFPDERRVYLKLGDHEWMGFVNEAEIRDGKSVKATILRVAGNRVLLGIRGTSPTSRSFVTERSLLGHAAQSA
jgi:hypothetical protein